MCPNMISTQAQEFIGMLSTVKHEIIHALVRVDVIKCVSLKFVPASSRTFSLLQEKDVWRRKAFIFPPSICVLSALQRRTSSVSAVGVITFVVFDFVCECLSKGFRVLGF